MVPELLGQWGAECLWLDTEHFPTGTETMAALVLACRAADVDSVVRIPNGEFGLAAKMFDLGADAIMYPRSRTVEEVVELIRWVRFPPIGRRGADTGVAAAGYGRHSLEATLQRARNETSVLVQIETPEALEKVDAIAAVKGVDILFLGPGDLSLEMGILCDPAEPALRRATEKVAAAAAAQRIHWGMPALSMEHASQILALGGRFVAHGSDSMLLGRGVTAIREQLTKLGVQYRAAG